MIEPASGEIIVSPDTRRPNRLPPGQTQTTKWPVLHYGQVPSIERSAWSFRIGGLVESEWVCDWEQFLTLPAIRVQCDIHCVTHWSRLDNVFEGPSVQTVMQRVQLAPEAASVVIETEGEPGRTWTTNLRLEDFLGDDCLFAYKHDGEWLTPEHGAPVRLVVPRLYFWKSAKWVRGVEVRAAEVPGFWEQNGYHMRGDPWAEERFGW